MDTYDEAEGKYGQVHHVLISPKRLHRDILNYENEERVNDILILKI